MVNGILSKEENDNLEKYGFGAYGIDFSGVSDDDIIALLEFIKKRVEKR